MSEETPWGWIPTYTGRKFEFLHPTAEMVDILDIGHALSNLCRFAGHTSKFYSVAEHSVLMSRCFVNRGHMHLAKWALMHDASEAYLVDVPRPLKAHLKSYAKIENRVARVIFDKFGLEGPLPEEVKGVDKRIVFDERRQLMGAPSAEWVGETCTLGIEVLCWTPEQAKHYFMELHVRLFRDG